MNQGEDPERRLARQAGRRLVYGVTRALATNPLAWKVAILGSAALLIVIAMIGGFMLSLSTPVASGQVSCTVTGQGSDAKEIPPQFIPLYRDAAARYGLGERGFSILAAIHKIESDFGKNMGPSSAGAIGQMQFMPATWVAYGVDGDGDGKKDPYDAADAIPAAARYLKANGAPDDWHKAILAYNHAEWYVQEVLDQAERFGGEVICQGTLGGVTAGNAQPQEAVRLTQPRAYVAMPGWAHASLGAGHWPQQSCDARMSADLLWLLSTYRLRIHDCRASGHNTHGDGTAADIVPVEDPEPHAGGTSHMDAWARVTQAAEVLGWRSSCGSTGCMNSSTLSPAIRAVFYNGFENHGDPAHFTGSCNCPHMHVSWMSSVYGNSSLVPPNEWTMAFPINGQVMTGVQGFEQPGGGA